MDKELNQIRQRYGTSTGSIFVNPDDRLWLPSRCLPLNYQLGGGVPFGSIMEEFGWESTGKSLLAADFSYATQYLGGKVLWNDAEFALADSKDYYGQLGLDVEDMEILEDDTVEVFSDWVMDMGTYYRSKLKNNEPILLVCDSMAALECEEQQNKKQSGGKAEMGNRAKAIYKFYRIRRKMLKRLGISTIMINQVRDKVGANMFQESTTTPGGAATAFYSSIRLALLKGKQIKNKDEKVGNFVHCHVKKNKVAPPKGKVQTEVHFIEDILGYIGYHRYAGLGVIGINNGLIKKKKGNYVLGGKYDLGSSRTSIDSNLGENGKARKYLIDKLNINTITKTQEKLKSHSKNLFPIPKKKKEKDG